jgi:hypothetical protein
MNLQLLNILEQRQNTTGKVPSFEIQIDIFVITGESSCSPIVDAEISLVHIEDEAADETGSIVVSDGAGEETCLCCGSKLDAAVEYPFSEVVEEFACLAESCKIVLSFDKREYELLKLCW